MNQDRLHKKRHKRGLKRKAAQQRARRRNIAQSHEREHALDMMAKLKNQPQKPGFLGKLFGDGSTVGTEQPDQQAAPIESAS